jgi:hypothetical protein
MRLTTFTTALCLCFPLAAGSVEPVPYDVNTPLPVAMTYCIPGEGCITCDSEMPRAAVNDLLELELAEGEVLLFTPNPANPESRDWIWKATGKHFPSVVEHEFSGRSNRDQPPACAYRAPLKGSHQPKSGTWEVNISLPESENCADGAPPPAAKTERQQGLFETPFRGRLSDTEPFASLVQVAPNSYMTYDVFGDRITETLMQVESPTHLKMYFADRATEAGNACVRRFTIEMQFVGEG